MPFSLVLDKVMRKKRSYKYEAEKNSSYSKGDSIDQFTYLVIWQKMSSIQKA